MAFVAQSIQQGLTAYAANKWVENFDNAVRRIFAFDSENLLHMVLYALLLTVLVVIFSRVIDGFVKPDENYHAWSVDKPRVNQ